MTHTWGLVGAGGSRKKIIENNIISAGRSPADSRSGRIAAHFLILQAPGD